MSARFVERHPLSDLDPAPYNPRSISDECKQRLRLSIERLGVVKPVIARNRTIVAGHQRTEAMRALGLTHAPTILLSRDTSTYDEITFNQMHNSTDLDFGEEECVIDLGGDRTPGFRVIDDTAKRVEGNFFCPGAEMRQDIMILIHRYGDWGACVCDERGRVFHASQYALCARILRRPLRVFVVPDDRLAEAQSLLASQYGRFDYSRLKRSTYIQTCAQLSRLGDDADRANESPTYVRHIIPWIEKHPKARVLDFGCGHGDYVKLLSKRGFDIRGIEFFRRKGRGQSATIDVKAVRAMIDRVVDELKTIGLYDAVVMDYVLNSVDSQQAEEDVLDIIGALCKPGGTLFFSGRHAARANPARSRKRANACTQQRWCQCLDANKLTASYRKGRWYYQKFHDEKDISRIMDSRGWRLLCIDKTRELWRVVASTPLAPQFDTERIISAINREFELPMDDNGLTVGRSKQMQSAWLEAIKDDSRAEHSHHAGGS